MFAEDSKLRTVGRLESLTPSLHPPSPTNPISTRTTSGHTSLVLQLILPGAASPLRLFRPRKSRPKAGRPGAKMAGTLGSILAHLRGIAIITPWALALLIQDLLLSLLLLLRPFNPLLAYRLSSPIAWSCWAGIQFIFERLNGARIVVSGDKLPVGESAVVIANHVGWSDFYMIQHLAIRAKMLGYCRYFAKAQLKKVPLLGWGLVAMGMPLVTRNCTF